MKPTLALLAPSLAMAVAEAPGLEQEAPGPEGRESPQDSGASGSPAGKQP